MKASGGCKKIWILSGLNHDLFHASENVIDFRRIIWFKKCCCYLPAVCLLGNLVLIW